MIFGLPEKELFSKGHRACIGCGQALAMRLALKAADENTILVQATGCGEVFSTPYPYTAYKIPYIHVAFENAAAVASGIEAALKHLKNYDARVLVFAGDGGTFDIGLQALSGAIERNHKFCYVCFDTAAYSNTGIQRSSATPKYADTTTSPAGKKIHGKMEWRKPLPMIIAAHKIKYVATASPAFPVDLYRKVKEGLDVNGPAYIQIDAPCISGWKINYDMAVEIARLAVETNVNPLYEIKDGKLILKENEKKKPVIEYLKLQGRFKHLNKIEVEEIQKHVDFEYELLKSLNNKRIF